MESADTDGASEQSYESVASEGGFEPANQRGRDRCQRIVSASHCVQVFQRLRYAPDGVHYVHDNREDGQRDRKKAARGQPARHDPLEGLPPRIMRFDGAMEAWLEEMPLGVVHPTKRVLQYTSLNDAAARRPDDLAVLRMGNRRATLWYFTMDFLQIGWPIFLVKDGLQFWQQSLLREGCKLTSTHQEIGQIHCPPGKGKARTEWLKALFAAMQSAEWTPDGEARQLLHQRRLSHGSMSIGDAVSIGREVFVACLDGFKAVKQGELLLPPGYLTGEEEHDEEEEDEDEEESAPASDVGTGKAKRRRKKRGGGGGGGENGKGGKGKGKGKGKGGGKTNGKDAGVDRADRRKLRAQLQAERDRVQGGH